MERRRAGIGKDLWGIGASLAALLGGFWLMVAPWALAFQPRGADWNDATLNSFWSGLGVTVVALAGVFLFGATLVSQLRAAGALPRPKRRAQAGPEREAAEGLTSERLEEALVPLAARLLEELASQQRSAGSDAHRDEDRTGAALYRGTGSAERGESL
ncbi:MAG: hypothetical protein QJR14_05660 [Bacillota bacterium]|nr:hypothetical protein [Bacillota bacterium]